MRAAGGKTLFRAGNIYREAGDLPAAEQSYLLLLNEREQGHIDSLDVSTTGFKAHYNLALVYRDMHRLADAERAFQTAVDLEPRFVPSWVGLAEIFTAMRRFADAEGVMRRVRELQVEGG
jgi:tetratricopeptide (TPR) repeat protein